MNIEFQNIIEGKICPYCECRTTLLKGEIIYPHKLNDTPRPSYLNKMFFVCIKNPDHYVGTYPDNITSLGRLADAELRRLKHEGHLYFEPLYKEKAVFSSRSKAYEWLSEKMGLPIEQTHFGMFNNEQCRMAIKFCQELT